MSDAADPTLLEPVGDLNRSESPLRMRAARLAAAAGARRLGTALYELLPGGVVAPYHLHHGNEELLLVLSGAPRLQTPDADRRLAPGAVVSFPPGPGGAHRISNPGPDPVRLLIVSTQEFPEIAEYPTTGTTLVLTGPGEGKAFPPGADADFYALYGEAIAADAADPAPDSAGPTDPAAPPDSTEPTDPAGFA